MERGFVILIVLIVAFLLLVFKSMVNAVREKFQGRARRTNTAWTGGMADAIADFSRLVESMPDIQQWTKSGEIAIEMLRTWDDGITIEQWARAQASSRGDMAEFGRKAAAGDRTLYGWYTRNYESAPPSNVHPQEMSYDMAIRFAFFFSAWDQLLHYR